MIRFRFKPARFVLLVAAAIVGGRAIGPILALPAVAGLAFVVDRVVRDPGRLIGRVALAALGLWIVTAPAVLFFDPATYAPGRRGHIERDPRGFYLIVSDDAAYIAASRTWDRTVANLLVPHNTHVVPTWRLLTWALVASAGSLQGLPNVLAVASYGILIAAMLMAGRLVVRETGRTGLGLATAVLVGTTSLMLTPAMWYSGSQPLWAGLGILTTLWYAQSYRRRGRGRSLVLASIAAAWSGGLWSAGHLAGPVAAVYLWLDGRRRCRMAAAVPLITSVVVAALLLSLATQPMDTKVSFHGRSVGEALNPIQGAITTTQAIPESLVFANLGLDAPTTPIQGIVLTIGLLVLWASRRLRGPAAGEAARDLGSATTRDRWWPPFAFRPMESAGAAMVFGCYMLEWTFRGYLEYQGMRTVNPYAVVPWYDSIPQVGAVLFAVGWWSGSHQLDGPSLHPADRRPTPPSRLEALGIALLALALVIVNRPRVDALIRGTCPALVPSEQKRFPIPRLQTMRADLLISMRVERQRRYLRRLDQAEPVARRLGIGQDGVRAAFGHIFIPHSTGRLLLAHRDLYDVAAVLNIPARGRMMDPAVIRAALGPYLRQEPEPRPEWLAPGEHYPEP